MSRMKGFNLIELVVAIAIIGILAAVAYPSYTDSVRKSRRAEAKAILAEQAQWMERIYSETFDYTRGNTVSSTSLPISQQTPAPGITNYYKFELTAADLTANTFTLTATPQAPQDVDGCKTLILNHKGEKEVSKDHTLPLDQCW